MYCPNPECPDFKQMGVPGEYVEGVTVCPFCGSKLVEQMPNIIPAEEHEETEPEEGQSNPMQDLDEEFVTVASYNFRHDAELTITFLVNQGIDVFASPDDCGGTDPVLGFATRTRLLVPKSQADQATALIKDTEEET